MGSVINCIECPNCSHEAYDDFYYKTGEEYIFCQNCGYVHSTIIKVESSSKTLDELTEDDWETYEVAHPYAAYQISGYGKVGYQVGSFATEEDFLSAKKQVEIDTTVETFSISRFVDGKIVVETIIDNGPEVDSAGFTAEDNEDLPNTNFGVDGL